MLVKLDLLGKTFDRLLVVSYGGVTKSCKRLWNCQCTCGNKTTVTTNSLKSGHTKSCGCLKGQSIKLKLVGKRFGRLTVIEEVKREERRNCKKVEWICKCDCGNFCTAITDSLRRGRIKSCGCLHLELAEKRLQKLLATQKREGHPNWRGGISSLSDEVRRYLKSIGWSNTIFASDGYTCQLCGDNRGSNLNAHHLISVSDIITHYNLSCVDDVIDCKLLFDASNGVTLCKPCHQWVHSNCNVINVYIKSLED